MRKILFSILIIALLISAGVIIANGLEIGNFQILGVKAIIAENENIDSKNQQLSNLVCITYPSTLATLETSSETLANTKKEYEDKAVLISNSSYYMQTEKYEIDFLWTRIGNYAKDNNVQIKMDIVNGSTTGIYDINFTVAGKYTDVIDFIYDIENDSKLGFKIEEFHMSSSGEGVQGTFSCKEININIEIVEKSEEEQNNTNTKENNTDSTDANTTENTTDSNSTNKTTE